MVSNHLVEYFFAFGIVLVVGLSAFVEDCAAHGNRVGERGLQPEGDTEVAKGSIYL